jgi:tetratricopeptide (TPR) repeat protein
LFGQFLLDVDVIDYESLKKYIVGTKSQIDSAFNPCFSYLDTYLDQLTGLAKFLALFYKSKRSYQHQRLNLLNQAYEKAREISPDYYPEFTSSIFLSTLGNEFYFLGKYEEAIASYDKALEINPDDDQAWNNRGSALDNLERYEEAIASYDKALEIKPDKYQPCYNRGVILGKLERYPEAIESYDKALEINPDHDQTWNNRGSALGKLERYQEAIESYDKALEIKPDKDQPWNNRGVILGKLGRYEEAIASYDKALDIKPDYADAFYNKACCYALQKEVNLALENLETAINLDNQYQQMAKTDTDFDNIRHDSRFQEVLNQG